MRPPSRDRTPAAPNAESGVPVFHIPSLLAYVSTACVLSLALWIPFAPARFASALALAAVFPGYALLRFTRIDLAPLERFALAVTVALSASTVAMVSRAPAPPSRCPVIDLVDVTTQPSTAEPSP